MTAEVVFELVLRRTTGLYGSNKKSVKLCLGKGKITFAIRRVK